ncbi:MAG: DUF4340 domain-containing protein [Gammaproteobacteria bacterium]|nr:DUF4340 domain-containing protein [Gammaproteobacteria bacterium]
MKSRLLLNIGLAILLAGIFVFLLDQQTDNKASISFLPLTDNNITRITIPGEHGDIQLIKKDNHWHMLSPFEIRAHNFRIRHLLQLLKTPIDKQYDARQLKLSSYELDPPKAAIYFNDTKVLFGKTNPVTQQRYLQIDKQLFLLHEEIFPLISSQATSFVDASIIPGDRKINKLVSDSINISLTAAGWKNSAATEIEADAIIGLIESWQSAQAFGVHLLMPRKNLGKIEISLDNGDIIKLEITDQSPWLILARPEQGIEYHLDPNLINKLFISTPTPDNDNA